MPEVTIRARDIGNIPRYYPEEVNTISIVERLNSLESKMSGMQQILDHTICDNVSIKERLSKTKTYSECLKVPAQQDRDRRKPDRKSTLSPPNNPAISKVRDNSVDRLSINSVTSKKSNNWPDDDGQFELPAYARKEQRRREGRRQKFICGKSTPKPNMFKGAPAPGRQLFIYRCDIATTETEISEYLSSNDFTVRRIECISNPSPMFKSFKRTVPEMEFSKLFESLWPEGVRIRKYFRRRNDSQTRLKSQ
ncbi:hypothetical protein SNE40_019980 [Patella caerulea]|uniref:Mutant cadherin n=1 Tax=Patella caerulea TaxID=87958 RepID=A0AAN8G6H3_PATCE